MQFSTHPALPYAVNHYRLNSEPDVLGKWGSPRSFAFRWAYDESIIHTFQVFRTDWLLADKWGYQPFFWWTVSSKEASAVLRSAVTLATDESVD